jgi:excisionase family DNA binding protein
MAPRKDKRRKVLAKRAAADVMTVQDVAVRLGIGRNQAYEAVARGQVPGAFRFGRRWLIPRVAFDRMLAGESTERPRKTASATAA